MRRLPFGYPTDEGGYGLSRNPPSEWSGRPESNRRRPAWEFPHRGLTSRHFLSDFITCRLGLAFRSSRFVTPSHAIWAASWAAGATRSVTRWVASKHTRSDLLACVPG